MLSSPVIIVGPPRSGTSAVARVLFESGIHMGSEFPKVDRRNPNGFYEDVSFIKATESFGKGEMNWLDYREFLEKYIQDRNKLGKPWGLKEPRLSTPILGLLFAYIPDPTIIRCYREKEATVKSMIENLGWDKKTAVFAYEYGNFCLDNLLIGKKVICLNMDNKKSDDEILNAIAAS